MEILKGLESHDKTKKITKIQVMEHNLEGRKYQS